SDSPLPSLNRKPQLGATLCSRFLAGVSQKESHFSKKVLQGQEVGGVPGRRPGRSQGFPSIKTC
ncbi:hypothetical protein, partial [Moorena sp. SIO4A1]|uniref:hypothetical protein n=1 Tax=Moorena sp. SIO4A1 TaxID=2607835 RepID=UPI0025CF0EB8